MPPRQAEVSQVAPRIPPIPIEPGQAHPGQFVQASGNRLIDLIEERSDLLRRPAGAEEEAQALVPTDGDESAQHVEGLLGVVGRCQGEEDPVDGLAVHRVEGDPLVQEARHPDEPIERFPLAMGQGEAMAQPGRGQALPHRIVSMMSLSSWRRR